jgi:hypothetical protein
MMAGDARSAPDQPAGVPAGVVVGAVPDAVSSGQAARIGDLADAAKVQITIVLMPKRAALAAQADAVNDPASPRFHHFLTFAEMKAQFMPSDADVASVETWARNGGLSEVNRWSTNHAIVLAGSAAQVNALLGVKLGQYRLRGATYFANDRAPTVAASVAPTIADILGLNSLDRFQPASVGPQSVRDATDLPHVATGAFVTTETLRIDANPKAPHGRMAAGVKPRISGPVGFGIEPEDIWSEQAYDYQGLAKFSHCCNPNNLATGSPVETSIAVIGAHKPDPKDLTGFFKTTYNLAANISLVSIGSPKCCDDEMTLDTEWSGATSNSMGTSNNTAHIYIYAAGSLSNGDLLNAWEAALSGNATRIATTSFSNIEPAFGGIGNSSISDYTDVTRAMTAMGWTLIAAAGDAGADGYTDSSSQSCLRGAVLYPPTDPNVLAAGGTSLTLNTPLAYGSETAWCGNGCGSNTACSGGLTKAKTDGGGGGGGCSDTFPATAWNPGGCAGKHRAIPDLSLNANAGQIIYYSYGPSSFCTGSLCTYDGTSIVAPELAGFFAQENAYLMTLGNNCGPSHDAACAPLGLRGGACAAQPILRHRFRQHVERPEQRLQRGGGIRSGDRAGLGEHDAARLGHQQLPDVRGIDAAADQFRRRAAQHAVFRAGDGDIRDQRGQSRGCRLHGGAGQRSDGHENRADPRCRQSVLGRTENPGGAQRGGADRLRAGMPHRLCPRLGQSWRRQYGGELRPDLHGNEHAVQLFGIGLPGRRRHAILYRFLPPDGEFLGRWPVPDGGHELHRTGSGGAPVHLCESLPAGHRELPGVQHVIDPDLPDQSGAAADAADHQLQGLLRDRPAMREGGGRVSMRRQRPVGHAQEGTPRRVRPGGHAQ